MLDRFFINNREGPRMSHAHWAHIMVGNFFFRIVLRIAKYLRPSFELGMNFQSYCRCVLHSPIQEITMKLLYQIPLPSQKELSVCARVSENSLSRASSKTESV